MSYYLTLYIILYYITFSYKRERLFQFDRRSRNESEKISKIETTVRMFTVLTLHHTVVIISFANRSLYNEKYSQIIASTRSILWPYSANRTFCVA